MRNIILFGIISLSFILARRDCLQQGELDALGRTNRPVKHTFAISPSGHFYIHFDTTGNAAPDLIDNNSNGVPDYIEEVGIIADSAHHVLVDIMEWDEEPFDGEGGYDIYIMGYSSGIYGYSTPDTPSLNPDGQTSYLKIDNDFIPHSLDVDISPLDIMRITLVHEYFHGIQWGYKSNLGGNAYFFEMSSMWFEDVMIPEGNDYLEYTWIKDLFDHPTRVFSNTGQGYELALFGHYLSSFIDIDGKMDAKQSTIMREIWSRFSNCTETYTYSDCNNRGAFYAVEEILVENYNTTFIESWVDFISRNLYNGIYENMDNLFYYYIDQELIDPIHTSTPLLSDSAGFVLELDDESVDIESFRIEDLESLITIDHDADAFTGRVAIVSSAKPELNNLFWGSDTTIEESFNNIEVHFIYGIDGSSISLPIEITAHTVPLPPSNLMAVAAQDSIILSWNPSPGPGENLSYVIFRDNDSIDVVLNDTTHVDQQNIKGGQSYTYKVTCRNELVDGESSASNAISVMSWPNEENVINSIIMNIYPNPIRQSQELTILYALDSDYSKPIVDLVNIRGEVVNSIKLFSFSQGWHRENINSILNTNPSNGVYFIRLQPDQESRHTKKITILN